MLKCFDKAGPEIIVCCGSGGVGKTTLSAAVGICGALSGKKTIVLTIDPARRLADSMGLKGFNSEPQRVHLEQIQGLPPSSGELYAMMLDAKRTFDQLIEKYAPADLQKKIFENRYYQYLSNHMAGSHEYMAMEKLYEIYHQSNYQLIVLDTPPTRRALDFLDAPQRLMNLLGHSFFWKLFKPYLQAGKWGIRLFSLFASPVLRVMGKVIGKQAFADLTAFMQLWDDALFEGFNRRAASVKKLLSSQPTLFMAITTPRRTPLSEALFFYEKLLENQMPFGGFIINRVHLPYPQILISDNDVEFKSELQLDMIDPKLKSKLIRNYKNYVKLAENDAEMISTLRNRVGDKVSIIQIPAARGEVADLNDVYEISRQLIGV